MLPRLAALVVALALVSAGQAASLPAVAHVAGAKPKPRHAKKSKRPAKPRPSVLVPNDPWWSSEWGLARIGMPALWWATARSTGSAVIAVVDTGVDPARASLSGAVLQGFGGTTDAVGHGSAVAEVAAGRGDDGIGAAGVCWRCRILPVEVAPQGSATAADLAAGIRFAVDHGANVVNLSLVLTRPDSAVEAAVADAQARGVLVVAAAGNGGGSAPTYPAAYPGVVGVVAVDPADSPYPWSTRGPWAALAAPGCASLDDGTQFCGSSAAAPVVSGLAGLLWSAGLASADRVRAALAAAVVPLDGSIAGTGRVDAARLAQLVSR